MYSFPVALQPCPKRSCFEGLSFLSFVPYIGILYLALLPSISLLIDNEESDG